MISNLYFDALNVITSIFNTNERLYSCWHEIVDIYYIISINVLTYFKRCCICINLLIDYVFKQKLMCNFTLAQVYYLILC